MVKRIEKHEIRVGMYVESLEGAWQDNPFGDRRFLLRSERDVELIKASRITGIYINAARGVDVDGAVRVIGARLPERKVDRDDTIKRVQESVRQLEGEFGKVRSGEGVSFDSLGLIVGDISAQIEGSPAVLLDMTRLKSKDKVTFLHSIAVSALLVHFGRYLSFEEPVIRTLGLAGLVHDIGKLAIPTTILNKTTNLTPQERDIIMQHPAVGHALLVRQGGLPQIVLDICRFHHERMDGKGYPDRIAAGDLSVFVRMSTICDVYEAITSVRPYKKPWTSAQALGWMLERGDHFDVPLLWKFIFSLDSDMTHGVA
jgi:HD-GYP domain-containing protein (c-di-GMP phosphodiesterase class II)